MLAPRKNCQWGIMIKMNRYTGTCLLFCLIFILRSTACALCAACTTAVMTKYLANPISPFKTSGKTKAVYMMELTVRLTPGAHLSAWFSTIHTVLIPLTREYWSRSRCLWRKILRKWKCLDDSRKWNFAKYRKLRIFAKMEKRHFRFKRDFRNRIKIIDALLW